MIELEDDDILSELKLLARNICDTENIVFAERSAKKIAWLMELWEDYKK